ERGRLGDLAVAEGAKDFEHLAPGRERPAIVALVLIHGLHELNFVIAVIAFAGGGVDLASAFALLGAAILAGAAVDGHGNGPLPPIIAATVGDTLVRKLLTHGETSGVKLEGIRPNRPSLGRSSILHKEYSP